MDAERERSLVGVVAANVRAALEHVVTFNRSPFRLGAVRTDNDGCDRGKVGVDRQKHAHRMPYGTAVGGTRSSAHDCQSAALDRRKRTPATT
jgi:hypothetical protein